MENTVSIDDFSIVKDQSEERKIAVIAIFSSFQDSSFKNQKGVSKIILDFDKKVEDNEVNLNDKDRDNFRKLLDKMDERKKCLLNLDEVIIEKDNVNPTFNEMIEKLKKTFDEESDSTLLVLSGNSNDDGHFFITIEKDEEKFIDLSQILSLWSSRKNKEINKSLLIINDTTYSKNFIQNVNENSLILNNVNIISSSSNDSHCSYYINDLGSLLIWAIHEINCKSLDNDVVKQVLKIKKIKELPQPIAHGFFFGVLQNFGLYCLFNDWNEFGNFRKNIYSVDQGLYEGQVMNSTNMGLGIKYYDDDKLDYYMGEWVDSQENGKGIKKSSNELYFGYFKAGLFDGYGLFIYENGDYYQGEFQEDLRNGFGVFKYKEGGIYTGDWVNDEMEGNGKYEYKNGDYYDGEWKNGVVHGKGKYVYENGDFYDGEYENDSKTGYGVFQYKDGSKYEGNWKDDKFNGKGKYIYSDTQDIYDGEWKNDLKNGYGIFYYSEGDRYEGYWRNDLCHGKGVYIYKEGDKYEGQYKDDERHGHGIYTYENGDIYDGNYVNGVCEGKGKYTYSNGDRYEGDYKNDFRCGHGKFYYNNGDKYEGQFKDDLFDGKGIFYYQDGEKYDGNFKEDNYHGFGTFYFKDGNKYVGNWVDNKKEGNGIYYYANGDIYQGNYKDDAENGHGIFTYSNGDYFEGEFKDGLKNGKGKFVYSNGKEEEGIWKDDEKL